jgi:hypothetical protein
MEQTILDINVIATQGPGGPTSWLAEVADFNTPFSGLFVFGPTLAVARAALATTIWAALIGAPDRHRALGIDPDHVTQIDLLTVTRKAFPVSALQVRASR